MAKKIILTTVLVLMSLCVFGCKGKEKGEVKKGDVLTEKNMGDLKKGKHKAEIKIADYGTIKVELDADSAPITVTNFINLVNDKFYDGLTIHRVVKNFVIQGGDPKGNGTGGSDNPIKGEFAANNVDNKLKHTRGALSMARANDYDSASSQFFIVQEDAATLDNQYAVFGYVTEGMEIVDKICKKAQPIDESGTLDKKEQPVIKSIRIIK